MPSITYSHFSTGPNVSVARGPKPATPQIAAPLVRDTTEIEGSAGGSGGAAPQPFFPGGVFQLDEQTVGFRPNRPTPPLKTLDVSQVSISPTSIPLAKTKIVSGGGGTYGDGQTVEIGPLDITLSWPDGAEWDGALISAGINGFTNAGQTAWVAISPSINVPIPGFTWFGRNSETDSNRSRNFAAFEATRSGDSYTVEFYCSGGQILHTDDARNWTPPTIEARQGGSTIFPGGLVAAVWDSLGRPTLWKGSFVFSFSRSTPNSPIRVRATNAWGMKSKWHRLHFTPIIHAQGFVLNLDGSRVKLPDDLTELPVGAHLEYDLTGSFDPDGELGHTAWYPNYYARAGQRGHYLFEDGEEQGAATPKPQQQYLADTWNRPTGESFDALVVSELGFTTRFILPDQGRYEIGVAIQDKDGIAANSTFFQGPTPVIEKPTPYQFIARRMAGSADAKSGVTLAAFGQLESIESVRFPGTFYQTWRQYSVAHYDGSTPATPVAMDLNSRSAPFKVWRTGAFWFCCQCNGIVSRYPETMPNIVFNPEIYDFENLGTRIGWKQVAGIYSPEALGDYGNIMIIGCEMSPDGATIYILARVWGSPGYPAIGNFTGEVKRFVLRAGGGGTFAAAVQAGAVAGLDADQLGPGDLRLRGSQLALIAQGATGVLIKTSDDEMATWN